jgi:site-specific recombinase XerD
MAKVSVLKQAAVEEILGIELQVSAPQDHELYRDVVKGYITRETGAKRYEKDSIEFVVRKVEELMIYSGKSPWFWSAGDFENWCSELAYERGLATVSQRKYQTAIRTFLGYMVGNGKFQQMILERHGIRPIQVCTDENCIPRVQDRELTNERLALTHEEIEAFFDGIDKEIERAALFHGKDLRPLLRDKAMFYLMYMGGLRNAELCRLNVDSFSPNPAVPGLGDFGYLGVWGKGSSGSGPKYRTVPITHAGVAHIMAWYLAEVRPLFLKKADPNDKAMFFSERGKRISRSALIDRFHNALNLSGLQGRGFVPHCLRHSSSTHESMRSLSAEGVRIKHGWANLSTAQIYNHIPDSFVQQEYNNLTEQTLPK